MPHSHNASVIHHHLYYKQVFSLSLTHTHTHTHTYIMSNNTSTSSDFQKIYILSKNYTSTNTPFVNN